MISLQIVIPRMKTDLQPAITKSLWQSAQLVRNDAVDLAPFKTGNLRRSITEFATSRTVEVWSNLEYARIHEFWWTIVPKNAPYLVFKIWWKLIGTKKSVIKAKPYLKPALEKNADEIVNIFTRNIAQII